MNQKVLFVFIGLQIFSFFSFTEYLQAKTNLEKQDYAMSWQAFAVNDYRKEPVKKYPYEACFRKAAIQYGLPLTLLLAVARGESDFNPLAASNKSCYGIMQIRWPQTANELGIKRKKQLFDPCRNIKAGARYIRQMLDRYNGNIHFAMAAYNYGPSRIGKTPSAYSLPEGAVWYSGYIFHHLEKIIQGSKIVQIPENKRELYKPGRKIPVILFHNPYRASNFFQYVKENSKSLRLDWFRTSLGETYIVMIYDTIAEKTAGIYQMKKIGYSVDKKRVFR